MASPDNEAHSNGAGLALQRPVDGEVLALRADVNALTTELLNRYEEITLLYDLGRDLGVVLDVDAASRTALERSLQVIPARLGLVLIGHSAEELRTVATYGDQGPENHRVALALDSAKAAFQRVSTVMVHAGASVRAGEEPIVEPVLVVPLVASDTFAADVAPVGALAFVGHEAADRFSAGEAQLSAVLARQLAQGVENARLISELTEKQRLESELEVAAGMQRSLLPMRTPSVPNATFAAACLPATQVGGDYYDFVPGADGVVHVIVADVAGHGMGPGLIMAMTRSVLRAQLRLPGSLADSLGATNAVMWDDLVAMEAFITLFAARYSPQTRHLDFVNGGHHPALLRHADGSITQLDSDGMPLGLLPSPTYHENSRNLAPGDAVLIFSDGVVEASEPDGAVYGTPRLQALLAQAGSGSAEDLIAAVLEDVTHFRGSGPQDDDITVVAMRVANDCDDADQDHR